MDTVEDFQVTVARRRTVAHNVVELELRRSDGGSLPDWTPGSHIDLRLTSEIERQYSLCGDLDDHEAWHIAVLHEIGGRGGSTYVHKSVAEGDVLRVRGPRNNFALVHSPEYVFIAGGIGITPLLPMIRQADRKGAVWTLVYGGRSRESMAYTDRFDRLQRGRVQLVPQDTEGVLDLQALLGQSKPETLVYCCGPEGLLQAVESACQTWPKGSLHVERFSARDIQPPPVERGFDVTLELTGRTVHVDPDVSILETLRRDGIDIPASCEEGTCGTCETRLISGLADHRDSILTPDEQEANDTIFPCVSRAFSDHLTLDC